MAQTGTADSGGQVSPRELLGALLYRAELDPNGVGADIKSDPVAALRNIGFSDDEASELLTGGAAAASVPAGLAGGCFDTTCFVSITNGCVGPSIPGLPGLCSGKTQCKIFSIF